jgi:hypothetical protein
MADDRTGALAWFNDASVSIAQKVAALSGSSPDLPASVADVLDQLDRWWKRWEGNAKRDALMEHRGEELASEYRPIVMDANEDSDRPPIVVAAVDREGRFRLPAVVAVYLELKSHH